MTYGTDNTAGSDDWHESPVQSHPLSVFPDGVRETIVRDLNDQLDDETCIAVDTELDPFCREYRHMLVNEYRDTGSEDLFSDVTDTAHCRVTNYVVDVGRGIGVLHAEDAGTVKERLVGSWMPSMFEKTDSRGRKNPRAFSYDGVLSQGNGLLTIIEEAGIHSDVLLHLLNIPDEKHVKLDKGVGMDVDTQLLIISNPDLATDLDRHEEKGNSDELKSIKRRLQKHVITYLTNHSLETQLLRRELLDETDVQVEPNDERVEAGSTVSVRTDDGNTVERELAPHTLEAAALFNVISRLDHTDMPESFTLIDKVRLYDEGDVTVDDESFDMERANIDGTLDGTNGIPVTYTRDIVADLLHEDRDRSHEELPVESVIMPMDVVRAMKNGFDDAPVFSNDEITEFNNRRIDVFDAIRDKQERDVLDAALHGRKIDEETVTEYLKHVVAWATDDTVDTEDGAVEPDTLLLKVVETEYLGLFDESEYDDGLISDAVAEWRRTDIADEITSYNYHRNDDGPYWDVPPVREKFHSYDWRDVNRIYENFDPALWDDPPEGTETAEVKAKAIAQLIENGYTEASAELTSRRIMEEEVVPAWQNEVMAQLSED